LLAYVFSHRPAADTDVTAYEDALRRFHAELARSGAAGFVTSTTYLAGGEYSDWYLVESSAALDAINEAAVSGSRSAPHDAAARMAASGSGKLLRLANGRPDLEAPYEIGFSKPAGMPYPALYESVDHFGGSLWRRMMVLGPPPEFCLVSRNPVELPAEFAPEVRTRRQI
jgi:hypothetical protein